MNRVEVSEMISFENTDGIPESIGGLGGFFKDGMRWGDYITRQPGVARPYAEAFRRYVISRNLRKGGDWHQYSDRGVPLFSDFTIGVFSFRAWGDIMAAIWSTEESRDYCYIDFYMS